MRIETEIEIGNLTRGDLFRWTVGDDLWEVTETQDAYSSGSFWLDATPWRPEDWSPGNRPSVARYQTRGTRPVWLVTRDPEQ